jgi:hypothetical protein
VSKRPSMTATQILQGISHTADLAACYAAEVEGQAWDDTTLAQCQTMQTAAKLAEAAAEQLKQARELVGSVFENERAFRERMNKALDRSECVHCGNKLARTRELHTTQAGGWHPSAWVRYECTAVGCFYVGIRHEPRKAGET